MDIVTHNDEPEEAPQGLISKRQEEVKINTNTIIVGNCLDILRGMPDESIDCVMTSPPYYGLRSYRADPIIWEGKEGCEHQWGEKIIQGSYGCVSVHAKVWNQVKNLMKGSEDRGSYCSVCGAWIGQLGLEPSYRMYLSHLLLIIAEIKRVLKCAGSLWWNIGDTYVTEDNQGLPSKCLRDIPARLAIRMVDEQGWTHRNTAIWYKRNHMPSPIKDRLTNSYEFVFHFVKSKRYYYDLDAIREPHTESAFIRVAVGYNTTTKASGTAMRGIDKSGIWVPSTEGKNPGDIWDITTRSFHGSQYAVYPPELCLRPILATCPPDGVVLDPFAGSGTTCCVAKALGRKYIGIEISKDYAEGIAIPRLAKLVRPLYPINKLKAGQFAVRRIWMGEVTDRESETGINPQQYRAMEESNNET